MNRQALAFLTMFSLILMLSVYYVTLPADTTTVMSTQKDGEVEDQKDASKSDQSDAEKLQEEITSKAEAAMQKQSEVVSNADSTDIQKQEALQTIDDLKSDQAAAQAIKTALSKNSFMAAVEISEGTCRINVFESEDNAENAKAIMDLAMAETGNKYLIEVTFK